ncbi:MAG TPA: hypothetical protein VMV40_02995 [Acidiferrobacter sp.]|nr:hypothetical protein [Acidiferrobacter sp.]
MNWLDKMAKASYGNYLTAMVLSGLLLGRGTDIFFHTPFYFTVLGAGLGLGGGLYRLTQMLGKPTAPPSKGRE